MDALYGAPSGAFARTSDEVRELIAAFLAREPAYRPRAAYIETVQKGGMTVEWRNRMVDWFIQVSWQCTSRRLRARPAALAEERPADRIAAAALPSRPPAAVQPR